ncbi:MAG TPA: ATP-binding protein, partial [Rhodospirillales bacterium]|nr:ATP-binding protein [Rhodospirillales bacterium]
IGRNPRILKSGHTQPEEYSQLWRSITSGNVWRGEFHNRRKDGALFWELASIAPVKDASGRISHYVGVKEDITDRKEMEEQLRQSQKMQALGQLTGGIAHDFNNLLAIIIGNLQLLGERIDGEARLRELFEDALWSAQRGAELTHRLLAFARRQPLKPDAVDFNGVIRGLSDLLRRTLGAGIQIREDLAPDLWTAYADRGELERALVNLAVNARDAMQGGGMLILETRNATIDEAYAEQYEELVAGDYVLLAVSDSGGGMSAEVMRHVFEPFFTTKAVGKGSGLGLSMVYGFVKQSGGHVEIDSRIGQGTTVKLYLPRALATSRQREKSTLGPPSAQIKGRVVLLVEDEAKLRRVATKMLDKLGLTILQAESAEEALALLKERRIDLLFTDFELPGGMNGAELADRARKLAPGIKILFTTGYARDTIVADRSAKDDMPWLLKPYSQSDLTRHLSLLLGRAVSSPANRRGSSDET